MGTAIALRGAQNVVLRNVGISGFQKGIEAVDAHLLLDRVNIQRCGVGMDLTNSYAAIHSSRFIDNAIDIAVNKSTAFILDTIAQRILEILPRGDYRINPYTTERRLFEIINTNNVEKKRTSLLGVIDKLKYVGYGWNIYQIISKILAAFGIRI